MVRSLNTHALLTLLSMMEWLSESNTAQTTSMVSVLTSWRPWGHRSSSVPAEDEGAPCSILKRSPRKPFVLLVLQAVVDVVSVDSARTVLMRSIQRDQAVCGCCTCPHRARTL